LFPAEVFDIEGSRDTEGSECEGDTEGVSESEERVMGAVAVVLKIPVPEGRGFLLHPPSTLVCEAASIFS
jgi:hypothetical protein